MFDKFIRLREKAYRFHHIDTLRMKKIILVALQGLGFKEEALHLEHDFKRCEPNLQQNDYGINISTLPPREGPDMIHQGLLI